MILSEFLQEISIKGWKLWSENGRLRYRAPNNEATSSVLEQLKEHKREILNLLQQQPNLLEVYPLSHGQQALWFLWQLAPESSAYNVAFSCRICSDLDVAALQKVFQVLTERHPILHSTFPRLGTEPIQQINLEQPIDFQQIDATNGSESELKEEVFAAYKSPFDLEHGPIMRVRVFTRSQQEHILLLVIHHIVAEGWSIGILLDELKVLYPAFTTGREATLPPPVHFHEYVRWQRTIIESAEGERLWQYWQQQLAGELPVLNLPTDRPRPSVQTYNGASYPLYLSETLTQQLKELAQSESTTLYTILLAAFNVLLHRYTDQDNILVGSPTASRHRPEFTQIVGYLVNPVVIRTNLSANLTFREFLTQVRNTVIAAIAHQDYPFPLIAKRLQPHRDSSRSTIFQASFVLQKLQQTPDVLKLYSSQVGTTIKWGELVLEPYEIPQQEGQFDLDLEIVEGNSSVFGTFKYNTDLFDRSTIERMASHFENLLSAIVDNPQQLVSELPLLSAAERHQLLVKWNDTTREYPQDKCIHQLFEEQVEKTPDEIALVYEHQQLSYKDLNKRSNQLAHYLQSLGVGPDVIVGLCVERSIEMVVGLLGILKAGGAYFPLDPSYPQERLAFMIEDAQVPLLLTQESLVDDLAQTGTEILVFEDLSEVLSALSDHTPNCAANSRNLSYVIYTSGSTGTPKGVMVEHRSICNHMLWMKATFGLSSDDKVLQKTPFSFDASIWEFYAPLIAGGQLIVAQPGGHSDGNYLIQSVLQQGVTIVQLVPSLLNVLLEQKGLENCRSLKHVFCGGEQLRHDLQQKFFARVSSALHNFYGPTEACIDATWWTCQEIEGDSVVPIGRPIANAQIYVLDSHLQPVPIGVAGELYIGGAGVARGYLNRPELTAQKFIANPFSDDPQARLYRTGDFGRWRADGNIEFLGRIDSQVKLRGFRIELGEIEAVLSSHPHIQQAVAIATEDVYSQKRLVAYVVSQEETLNTNQIREFLQQQLPAYMVPSAFVILDTIPLTANGKIDRLALRALDDNIEREREYVAPQTQIEQILTTIWQELLLREQVSIHDNFFEIGGDSILSIQVVSRAKTRGVQITPKQIFQHQTIAELAKVANTTTVLINARQGLVTGVAPLTPIQHWFFAQNHTASHHYNQSVLLQIPKDLSKEFIATAWEKLLLHHDALRLRFPESAKEQQLFNHSLEQTIPFAVVDLSTTVIEEQPQALEKIASEYQASLNLSTGPIVQVVMFDLGRERDGRLLIIIHHLAVDGVSWRILLSDLETIYQQLVRQQPIQLAAKTTAFIDWAEKLNHYAQSEVLKSELGYWLNQPWEQATALPLDCQPHAADSTKESADEVSVTLSAAQTHLLLGPVHKAYNTQINDLLLTGLVLTLAEWTGNSTVLIDLEGHGREELFEEVDLSRTVGWFTTIFPVLLQLPKSTQPAAAIKSLKEQLRAIPHRGIGYGILRYLCADTEVCEQLQRIPTPEISFNYLGQFDSVQSETGWKIALESIGPAQSPLQNPEHRLDISCLVIAGKLEITWSYSSQIHQRNTIENLAQNYVQNLRAFIEHCQLEDAYGYTPSDFPDAQLNQLELDELLASITAKNLSAIYPLSPMQQGMLFHSLYAPESGVYVEQMTLKLKGDVNVAAFKEAWQKVVDRYSILRTLFIWENRPTPLQVVLKQVDLPWTNLDWRSFSTAEQQQQLSELLTSQKQQGFQFKVAPLMECTFIQLSHDTYEFIWNHHHILIDGWCLPIIFKEVLSFYSAELQGETCHLPTPRPYRDYIAWLNAQDKQAASEFWRQTLQGFSAPTPLVVELSLHQSVQPSNYQELELRLSTQVSHKLQALTQQHHLTLSTILQAAWGILLSRYSGERDIVFGVTVSGRPASLSGVEDMVGLFINTLPLRLLISPDQQLIPWLEQIQQLMLELQHYSYTPLVEIQSLSEVPGGTPLFESIVVFENYPIDSSLATQTGSLQLSEIESYEQTNYPLTIVAVPGDELLVKISYDSGRFAEDTIERMLGHLQTIFSAIADNPQQAVSEIPLLSAKERHQLLVEWNDTARKYPQDKCIHSLFEEQVAQTPDAVAVVFEQQQLTYQQLNHKANQLANYLQTLGVRPEVLVGICVERSLEMLVGLLGILKAGGAYVPLDPTYPQERLSYMLSDAAIEVLLTQDNLLSSVPSHAAQVVCLDTDWQVIEQHSQENLVTGVKPDNLAYVIYTSGSTGQPKGVLVAYRNLVERVITIASEYCLTSSDKILQFAALSFDVAIEEIFPSWLSGATVVLLQREMFTSVVDWVEFIDTQSLTVLNLPAAFWHEWILDLSASQIDLPSCLRLVIVGSEQVQWSRVALWQKHVPSHIELYNAYGVTEAIITATIYKSDLRNSEDQTGSVPIGRPISNTQIYILDQQMQPVPVGVPGELYIGGDGLARGYLNRPELTCEKFIPNLFSPDKSTRLYKTGDIVRYLSDGNIEFLGRVDHQVKIRGFRIELGEIEAVLSSHPHIQQAVAIAIEDVYSQKRLVAYVVSQEETLTTNQIREFLKQQLPEYMVPSVFVTLDTIPLTPNGKIDRKALPTLNKGIIQEHEYVAPRTVIEQILTTIWQELLLFEQVSIHDNFFEIGGDSILSIQVVSRAKTRGVQITPKQIFQHQTIAELARVANTTTVLVNARQGLVTGVAPLTPIQHWFFAQNHTASHHYNQSVLLQIPKD
ncbi:MAG: amino acid adenylation domain-containing protein, partial [Scytonema sp. RU_4_4]|nr:amino acid adenylation domain-containing protein [Scytonema sp. RU_4_4]